MDVFCTKCGTQLVDGICPNCSGGQFCTKCGTQLVDGICPNCSEAQSAPQYQQPVDNRQPVADNRQDERFKDIFVNPKEKFICALGNSYLQSFLAGGFLGKGYAIVSDKRFYFNGKAYEINGNKINVKKTKSTVDLRDITGTEVRTFANIALLIWGAILVIGGLVIGAFYLPAILKALVPAVSGYSFGFFVIAEVMAITFFIRYGLSKKTVLTIMFGGGGISVPINWYSSRESEKFQRMLRRAKDNVIRTAENATAEAIRELAENIGTQTVNS